MKQQSTIGVWMLLLEKHYGGLRAACRATGVDPGNWHRLKNGQTQPESGTLEKLGLRVAVVLYEEA